KTPWVSQWTLHTVEIPDEAAAVVAEQLSQALEATQAGSWYADFKNQTTHYIIFRNRVFRIDRHSPQAYEVKAVRDGVGHPRVSTRCLGQGWVREWNVKVGARWRYPCFLASATPATSLSCSRATWRPTR